jgi:cation transport regulator ChaC
MTLDRGGECKGVVYCLPPGAVEEDFGAAAGASGSAFS